MNEPIVTPPFSAAHASASDWTGACRRALDRLRPLPAGANVGFLYVTDQFADHVADIHAFFRRETPVDCWVGTVGMGICASGIEYFDEPALAVMVGRLPQNSFDLFDSTRRDIAAYVDAQKDWFARYPGNFGVIHIDPRLRQITPQLSALGDGSSSFLVGALTSSRSGFGQIAGQPTEGGISGLMISGGVPVATGLTQGCSPIGTPHVVTQARDNLVVELDDRPALDVFREDIGELLARDLKRVAGYIFAALPVQGTDWGDYLVRNLTGIDIERGLIAIGDYPQVGQQLMFCRRDRAAAEEDMRRMLRGLKERIDGPPQAALYHSCLARGPNMFGDGSAELGLIQEELGDLPLVGFFGNGEISNSRLYTYTGVLSLFL